MTKTPVGRRRSRTPRVEQDRPAGQPPLMYPELQPDPMPRRIEPCLAQVAPRPPEGDDWGYEVKWDGYRLAAHLEPGGKVRILTRRGHDWTERFPSIAAALVELGPETMILDGEGVFLDSQGRADFGALQTALGGRGGKRHSSSIIYYAFDVLYLDGYDTRMLSLIERRVLLEQLLEGKTGAIRLSEMIDADGAVFLEVARGFGLEGIIAKRLSSHYRSGRHGEWRKIKCVQSETFAIIGYVPSRSGWIANISVAARKGGQFVYVGSVGTGFTQAGARDLRDKLDRLQISDVTSARKRNSIILTRPELAAEIQFRGWTSDGKLRHASFKGLREIEDSFEIYDLGRETED